MNKKPNPDREARKRSAYSDQRSDLALIGDEILKRRTVLLVEDDPALREMFARTLEIHGFEVTEARDGEEALRIYEGARFDFVLTDYQMPRMNGHLLLMAIRRANPAQRMALMSADPPVLSALVEDVQILHKPFETKELLRLISEEEE